jgi:hypothetical protein
MWSLEWWTVWEKRRKGKVWNEMIKRLNDRRSIKSIDKAHKSSTKLRIDFEWVFADQIHDSAVILMARHIRNLLNLVSYISFLSNDCLPPQTMTASLASSRSAQRWLLSKRSPLKLRPKSSQWDVQFIRHSQHDSRSISNDKNASMVLVSVRESDSGGLKWTDILQGVWIEAMAVFLVRLWNGRSVGDCDIETAEYRKVWRRWRKWKK